MTSERVPVERIVASAYRIPTDRPESDGTFEWNATTVVVVEVFAGGMHGVGYSYTGRSAAVLANELLAPIVTGADAMNVAGIWESMRRGVRNVGFPGIAASAIAAVDSALWDLKCRLLDVPLVTLLGAVRDRVPVYGSGGFTSYSIDELREQLAGWRDEGIRSVKMKVAREKEHDCARVRAAREAIGPDVELFVDANGGYSRKYALRQADLFAEHQVSWFEEPVSSDDLEGLRLLRDRAPAGMEVAAGEYGYTLQYFRQMLEAGAVDVLQADATRCAGITGFLQAGELCAAHLVPLSAHTAPTLHVHTCCALTQARHVEYFHDHVRVEAMLFDGAARVDRGDLVPDLTRPGLGIEIRRADAARYAI